MTLVGFEEISGLAMPDDGDLRSSTCDFITSTKPTIAARLNWQMRAGISLEDAAFASLMGIPINYPGP